MSKHDEKRQRPPGNWPTRAGRRAATVEEAEIALTRLFAEWELRLRRLRMAGSDDPLNQSTAPGSPEYLAAEEQVVQQLAALGPAALEPLIRAARPAATSRLALGRAAIAAQALGRIGDFRAVPALLAALRDQRAAAGGVEGRGTAPLRAAAARALGTLKAEAAATLYEQALVRQSADDWQAEAERLSALRLETVVEALMEALGDPAPEVRVAAADACIDLCLAEPPQALLANKLAAAAPGADPSPLETSLEPTDSDEEADTSALALAMEPLKALLLANKSAAAAPGADPPPPEEAHTPEVSYDEASTSALALAVEPLSAALKDEYAAVRATAATALGWIGDRRAAPALARCLKDVDEECRIAAARALGLLGSPTALKPLARALGDPSVRVRKQVAESLGWLGEPVAADLLVDTLEDEEESLRVRAAAVRALGNLYLPQALPILLDVLDAPEPALRLAAVEALGNLGFGRTYRQIAPLLWRDPDRAVRHAAARVVAQLAEARQGRARWRLRLALRVSRQARQEALAILAEHGR